MKKINEWMNKSITWKDSIIASLIGMAISLAYLAYELLKLKKFKY